MHVVRVLSNMHVNRACNMHVMCMLYECKSNKHVGSAFNVAVLFISEYPLNSFIRENLFQ